MAGAPVTVRATVWCRECSTDKRQSELGATVELPYPLAPRLCRVLWHAYDERYARDLRALIRAEAAVPGIATPPEARWHKWITVEDPGDPDLKPPERLTVYCRRHGPASIATGDVIGKRGRLYPVQAPL